MKLNDTDVELFNGDIVKVVADENGVPLAAGGIVGHRYLYIGEDTEVVLRGVPDAYESGFENYTLNYQTWTTGGGWMRYKTTHMLTTQSYGEKDYYTHTLKADYPIEIQFIRGPAAPSIAVDTAHDLYIQGTVTSPVEGTVTLKSAGDLVFAETAAILGASPAIEAGGSVRANVEGGAPGGGSHAAGGMVIHDEPRVLNITSDHDIEVRVVYDPTGNRSSTLVVGRIVSTGGNVILHA
ncbi:MAG: hypothetical protein JRJ83_18765, partial [Deltaproteobacteria bacterium]|nr:hypothetical protein [Deltaproteobacteria bacterium]